MVAKRQRQHQRFSNYRSCPWPQSVEIRERPPLTADSIPVEMLPKEFEYSATTPDVSERGSRSFPAAQFANALLGSADELSEDVYKLVKVALFLDPGGLPC